MTIDLIFWVTVGIIMILVIMSAFFSGSETALTAASPGKLRIQADKGDKGASKALGVLHDRERLIGAILLGNNLMNILAASLATSLFTRMFGESGVALAAFVMTALVLVFAEVLPKTYAITNSEKAASRVAGTVGIAVKILSPIVSTVRWIVNNVLKMIGVTTDPNSNIHTVREEISSVLQLGQSNGTVDEDDRSRIMGTLDLNTRSVDVIMRHRTEIEMVNAADSIDDIMDQCLKSPYTRLPIFVDNPENVVGVIHTKDLFRAVFNEHENADMNVRDIAMNPYFIPETTVLDDQLHEFKRLQTHLALIVDEYGVLMGMVTLEDILEEIVGEITDELDPSAKSIMQTASDGSYMIDGNTELHELSKVMKWDFSDDNANTLAGLLINEIGVIPEVGQIFRVRGFQFEIVKMSGFRISKLKISPVK